MRKASNLFFWKSTPLEMDCADLVKTKWFTTSERNWVPRGRGKRKWPRGYGNWNECRLELVEDSSSNKNIDYYCPTCSRGGCSCSISGEVGFTFFISSLSDFRTSFDLDDKIILHFSIFANKAAICHLVSWGMDRCVDVSLSLPTGKGEARGYVGNPS